MHEEAIIKIDTILAHSKEDALTSAIEARNCAPFCFIIQYEEAI